MDTTASATDPRAPEGAGYPRTAMETRPALLVGRALKRREIEHHFLPAQREHTLAASG